MSLQSVKDVRDFSVTWGFILSTVDRSECVNELVVMNACSLHKNKPSKFSHVQPCAHFYYQLTRFDEMPTCSFGDWLTLITIFIVDSDVNTSLYRSESQL